MINPKVIESLKNNENLKIIYYLISHNKIQLLDDLFYMYKGYHVFNKKELSDEDIKNLISFQKKFNDLLVKEILDFTNEDLIQEKTWIDIVAPHLLAFIITFSVVYVMFMLMKGSIDTKDSIVPMVIGILGGYMQTVLQHYFTPTKTQNKQSK